MKKINIIISGLCLLVAGCVTPRTQIAPIESKVEIPEIGVVSEAELGDTIIKKGNVLTYDGIELRETLTFKPNNRIYTLEIPQQTLMATMEDRRYVYYYGENISISGFYGLQKVFAGMKVSKKNPDLIYVFCNYPALSSPLKNKPAMGFCKAEALKQNYFLQELIYNGKTGNQVKFLYREITGNLLRTPFNQEAIYDLGEGNVIGFKGARIEVIEASNTNLKYKVIESFPRQ